MRGAPTALFLRVLAGSAVIYGAACAPVPAVNGVAGAPPSPAAQWTPPPRAALGIPRDSISRATPIPADLAARVQTLTVSDVTDLALRNNPATHASWAQARAAAAVYGASLGKYFPTIDANASVSRSKALSTPGRPAGLRTQYGPTVTLNMLLLDLGGRGGSIDAARQALFAADFTHNATVQTTILQAQTAFFTYMATRALLDAQQSVLKEAQANLAAAQQRHDVGLATVADVLQARTALSQVQLNLATTQGNLQTARGALAVAMGLPANLPFDVQQVSDTMPVQAVSATVDSLINTAVQSRPDLAAARAQALAAADQIRVARAAELPSLTLNSNAGQTHAMPSTFGGPTYALSLGLQIPLFNGFARQYDVRNAQALAEVASARAEQLRQQVITQVFVSYYALQTATQRVTAADDLLRSAQQSAEVAAGRYREGVGNIIDLLTAEGALADARAQQVQARWQWQTALAQLAHDIGGLKP